MTNEDSALGSNRRTPRQGVGGSPVGSWLTIALAVIAVLIGFLILRNITDDGGAAGDDLTTQPADDATVGAGSGPSISVDVPTTDATTTTTSMPRVTTGATVLVANANTVGGSAGAMTKTLELAGYTTIEPLDASGPNLEDSLVYYDPSQAAAQDVANSVADDLGGLEVLELPTPAPTASGDIGDAGVMVVLGENEAGKTLEELGGTPAEATTEAPAPAGGETPATAPPEEGTAEADG
ncbi:LytR C-terminal domain-containing protein [Ilumatobacter nonamiensis]|uniref:LytR C-terminal domain-containing protein n=1 Tax=Ilumatobacter nonamiensis TaxID=467093 RepID=UPI00034B519C|nr:LytR C-terminal domain-containing protein [Ilumatobacter nonamiensis]